jgi:hypothetical protein
MNRFVFHFTDSDFENKGRTQPPITYFFDLNKADGISFDEGTPEGERVLEFAEEVESDYGVHDWATTCNDKTNYFERVGYNSYEVPADKWDELIKKWHSFFDAEGFDPGPIQALHPREYYAQYYPWAAYEEDEN